MLVNSLAFSTARVFRSKINNYLIFLRITPTRSVAVNLGGGPGGGQDNTEHVPSSGLQDLFCHFGDIFFIHGWREKAQHSMTTFHSLLLVQGG